MFLTHLAVAAVAALAPLLSHAASVTYDFTVQATSGPLNGQISNGYLTYDDSIVPPVEGFVIGSYLTDLSFVWGGVTYDETTANTGFFYFDAAGAPITIVFGTNCDLSGCGAGPAGQDWFIRGDPGRVGSISYATGIDTYGGTVETSLRTAQVPEPASLALAAIALAGLSATLRRKS